MKKSEACQLAAAILRRMADVHEADERKSSIKDPERAESIRHLREISDALESEER